MPEPLVEPPYSAGHTVATQIDWIGGIAAKVAEAIDGDHEADREFRIKTALELATAFEEVCYDLHGRFYREAFLRRCGTPTLREAG
jgi:hypothetical protein